MAERAVHILAIVHTGEVTAQARNAGIVSCTDAEEMDAVFVAEAVVVQFAAGVVACGRQVLVVVIRGLSTVELYQVPGRTRVVVVSLEGDEVADVGSIEAVVAVVGFARRVANLHKVDGLGLSVLLKLEG